ncbi:uncharacterized protein LOC113202134 [Frankliniella occidentalis]|uniref:Uncharacterized protein LOC113202134 n=1 Tax=Frankliniella occidentalis TaxID=133901 RepID=A0A6J1RSK4_FRAOC|nr:uncharacterized protein LOC113202134 [Frankliniella occidentalis]
MSVMKSICSLNPRLKCLPSLRILYYPTTNPSPAYSTEAPPPEEPVVDFVPKIQRPGRQSLYEPDYLDILKPKIPKHDILNFKLKGYDYAVLERLQQILHKYFIHMGVTVADSFARRAESFKIQRFEPNTSKAMTEFNLKEYERVIQVSDLPASKLGTVIEVIQAAIPTGVTCSIVENTEEEIKSRYIPDREMNALQQELEELGGPSQFAKQKELKEKHRIR